MGSDHKHLLLINAKLAEDLRAEYSVDVPVGTWLEANRLHSFDAISRGYKTTYVEWMISTTVESVFIGAWVNGRSVRTLAFEPTGDPWSSRGGWKWHVRGKPLPFENTKELTRWLKRKSLLASPDGYDILKAFLGGPWNESTPLATPEPPPPPTPSPPRKKSNQEKLQEALQADDWAAVARLVKKRECADSATSEFHHAVQYGDRDRARKLVQAGVNPNALNYEGLAAIHRTQEPGEISFLVKLGADLEAVDRNGYTPLLGVMTNVNPNSAECLKALLKAGANPHAKVRGEGALTVMKKYVRRTRGAARYAPELEAMIKEAQLRRPA